MNIDLDDPLAGILSDGSDDSFFDDDILGKKKPAKKNSTPSAERKNALFDLDDTIKTNKGKDGISSEKQIFETTTHTADNTSNLQTEIEPELTKLKSPGLNRTILSKEPTKVQQVDMKKKSAEKTEVGSPAKSKLTTSVDKLDMFDDLRAEQKNELSKTLQKGKSSQSLLDDILGGSVAKSNVNNQKRPLTAAKKTDFDFDSILGKSESKQNLAQHKNVAQKPEAGQNTSKEVPLKKKSTEDWLDIFQEKDEIVEDDYTDIPAWLGGVDSNKKKNTANTTKTDAKPESAKEVRIPENKDEEFETNHINIAQVQPPHKSDVALTSKLEVSSEDVTLESAALYLQQQESQIMVALQLKAQDEKLAAMQARQKDSQRVHREAAQAQREQLESLLQRQAQHRQQMQAIIAAHQERITNRIKSLLGTNSEDQQEEINTEGDFETTEQRPSPYTKEKQQLLQLIQSLQENHDKEIDLMETSYRRQLAFSEVSFVQAEERMKEESDKLVKYYKEKISWVEEHHHLYKKLTEDNLNSLTERHKAESEMLRQQHLDNIKVLQEHHTALMENVKNAVKQEQALIKDSTSFSSELNELLMDVKDNKLKCNELTQKIETLIQNTQQNTDKSIQTRETQISDMIQHLKMDRENFDKEKAESKDLFHILESRLKQMTTMIEEESAALKQKKMEFEFEKATFSKQTEFAKNVLKKQDEEVKILKDDIKKEYREKITKIEEEKAAALKDSATVAREKASVQTLKLELEKTRAELQAQLEEVTSDRSKLQTEKQELHIEEQRLMAKSRDLDLLVKSTMDKQVQAEKKHSEAEFAQQKYEERIRKIQEHVVSLNNREKQIAKEKVALSRERLSIHNEKKQLECRQQCSLCRSTQYNENAYNLPETYFSHTVSRDYSAIPVNVDQEMANLMRRSFKLRHSPMVNVNFDDRRTEANEFDSAPATQTDSGAFKEYLDPKFMMLRLDVQQVISNLDQKNKENDAPNEDGQ